MMMSTIEKYSIARWIACCVVLLSTGCAGTQEAAGQRTEPLPLGLYQVVERQCVYAPGERKDYCSRTQYIELVKGVFYGFDKDQVAFVAWQAENPLQQHEYVARDLLRGSFPLPGEFVIEENEFGKEWFVIQDGAITDYFFVSHPGQTSAGMAGETHLSLQRVRRNADIDRLLAYPLSDD